MDEYRIHYHVTPTGRSALSVRTDSGHTHEPVPLIDKCGKPIGDFKSHIHVTGYGPSGVPVFGKE